jgi:flavodoxin I
MKKIGLIFWPTKGNVEKVAKAIYDQFDPSEIDVLDLEQVKAKHLFLYKNLILGCSTVGADHWESATVDNKWYQLFHQMSADKVDLNAKTVAIYGLGDQIKYPHHFVDGMEMVYQNFMEHNVHFIGSWPNEGYEFYESKALEGTNFRGLALDLDNQSDKMETQVNQWIELIKKEL